MKLNTYTFFIFLFLCTSCSQLPWQKRNSETQADDLSYVSSKDLELMKLELQKDFREVIREEVMPEILGLNSVPRDVRKKQASAKSSAIEKIVLGRIEKVKVISNGMQLVARVDTGAQSSSMHAINIKEKSVEGKEYVEFETFDHDGKKYAMLKEVVKKVKVKTPDSKSTKRYVVRVRLKIGTNEHSVNVTLSNRDKLDYKFLIGRNLLMGNYIVDVSQTRLLEQE